VLLGLLVLAAALVGATAGLLLVYSTDLPQVDELEHYRPSSITQLYDGQGHIIGSFALQRRVVATYDDYPPVLRDALISIEDKDFYRHWGINVWRIMGAAYRDIESGGKVQGASTLTMQLARNLFLSPDRSFHRKIQEALLAIQIERKFTKSQIFTLYANQIFLGHGAYGFESASEYYFSKPAKKLNLEEAALLAGLPKAPQYYSPIMHPDRALKRRNLVINALLEDGKITAQQAADARARPLHLNVEHDPNSLAPYYVEEIRRYLETKYGSDQVHEGGLRVYTSLDMDLQRAANRAVLNGVGRLRTSPRLEESPRQCAFSQRHTRHLYSSRLGRRTGGQRLYARARDGRRARSSYREVRPLPTPPSLSRMQPGPKRKSRTF